MSFINNLNTADFVIMIIILIAMLFGYLRGFIREFFSLFSIFFSGYLSIYFYPNISLFLTKFIKMGIINDIVSLSVLFFFIYSCFGILIRAIAKKINSTSLEIFDKNFGILFGFLKAMVIFSILNIILIITIWKENYPKWALEAKSFNMISYSSEFILKIAPANTLTELKKIFKIESLPRLTKDSLNAEQYGEPQLNNKKTSAKDGYSDNDNESLNKLFNIENND